MNKTNQRIWLMITTVFAIGITAMMLTPMVLHPWNVVPELGGDGGKNIFTFLYHSIYGKGIWFTGMNYPYGEHIVYTDGQPLLSVTLSSFKNISIAQALTVMGWLISLSYILSIIYIYKILLHFGLKPLVAILFAGLVGIFTPQGFRVHAHYALAYSCIIPMLFFWTISYSIHPKWKYSVYIFILGCLFTFLHPYYMGLVALWVLSYAIGYFIFTKTKVATKISHVLPLLTSAAFLILFITLLMKLTDPAKDRTVNPYGTLAYCTTGKQILTSDFSPVWRYIKDHTTFKKVSEGGEGYTYPGIAVIIAVLLSLAGGVIKMKKKNGVPNLVSTGSFSPIWIFMAITSLLFSMGIPFIWHMEWLLDYVSFFRQFRTLGRFSWIFYYLITIYGAVIINGWYVKYLGEKKPFIAYSVLITALVLWSYEASGYIIFQKIKFAGSADNINVLCPVGNITWAGYLKDHHFKPADFQAVLILKFFEAGSEKLGQDYDVYTQISLGIYPSIQLHLPMIDAMMSRTSWSVAEKQVKLLAGSYVHKPILDDIKNDKPFLLLHFEMDSLNVDEKYLLSASDFISHFAFCDVYACYPARLRANDRKNADSVNALIPYVKPGNDSCFKNTGTWHLDHFDSVPSPQSFFGSGAIPQILKPDSVIANIPVTPVYNNQLYEFSCWFLLSNKNYLCPSLNLDLLDSSGGVINSTTVFAQRSTDNHGLWFRASSYFTIPSKCRFLRCRLINEQGNSYRVMDEMMLKPADALIISKAADGSVMVNNHLFFGTQQ